MHNEERKENKENFIKLDSLLYNNKDKMIKEFYKNNNTIIQQLFFFETYQYCFCNKCRSGDYGYYSINCVLELDSEINKKEIKIYDLLDNLLQIKDCEKCNKRTFKSEKKFNSCPKILIIVIKHNNKLKGNFKHIEKIEFRINNYDIHEYELVSFIKKLIG